MADFEEMEAAAGQAVELLREQVSINMSQEEVGIVFEKNPELYESFVQSVDDLQNVSSESDVAESLLQRAAEVVDSSVHKEALDAAVRGKDVTECVCLLKTKNFKYAPWSWGSSSNYNVEVKVEFADFDQENVQAEECADRCMSACKNKDAYKLDRGEIKDMGMDIAKKSDKTDFYAAAQCNDDGDCFCLDTEKTQEKLTSLRPIETETTQTSKIDIAVTKKTFKKDTDAKKCLKVCKRDCDKKDSKDMDVEGMCIDEWPN